MDTDAAQNLCVFDIPEPTRRTSDDADVAELDAAVEREVAAGFDVAESRLCEM